MSKSQSIVTKGNGEIILSRFEIARMADAAGGDCYRIGVSYGSESYENRMVKTVDDVNAVIRSEIEKRLS